GSNVWGQLGLGDKQDRGDQPGEMGDALPFVDLGQGAKAVAIAVGELGASCAVLEGGALKCWGSIINSHPKPCGVPGENEPHGNEPGEMGDALPVVDLKAKAIGVSLGPSHQCALLEGGAVKCWGTDAHGSLGLNTVVPSDAISCYAGLDTLAPIELGTGAKARAVTVGFAHSCTLLTSGRVKCWGSSDKGELGLGDTQARGDQPGEMGDSLPLVDLGKKTAP
ncbi:MAG: hypothetical protein EOO75_17570, partial [Myxococcales bacterium]